MKAGIPCGLMVLLLLGGTSAQTGSSSLSTELPQVSGIPGDVVVVSGILSPHATLGGIPVLPGTSVPCTILVQVVDSPFIMAPSDPEPCALEFSQLGQPGDRDFTFELYIPAGTAPGTYQIPLRIAFDSSLLQVEGSGSLLLEVLPLAAWSYAYDVEGLPVILNTGNVAIQLQIGATTIDIAKSSAKGLQSAGVALDQARIIDANLLSNRPDQVVQEGQPMAWHPEVVRPSLLPAFIAVGGMLSLLVAAAYLQRK